MQSIELTGLQELEYDFERVLRELPEARRELHERIGRALKREVDAQIGVSGLDDGQGKIRGWQKDYVGSLGGYAAVRAIGSADGATTGPNSPGAITNYLESGHYNRPPSGKPAHSRVRGYRFYRAARAQAERVALDEANAFADEIAAKLEGQDGHT